MVHRFVSIGRFTGAGRLARIPLVEAVFAILFMATVPCLVYAADGPASAMPPLDGSVSSGGRVEMGGSWTLSASASTALGLADEGGVRWVSAEGSDPGGEVWYEGTRPGEEVTVRTRFQLRGDINAFDEIRLAELTSGGGSRVGGYLLRWVRESMSILSVWKLELLAPEELLPSEYADQTVSVGDQRLSVIALNRYLGKGSGGELNYPPKSGRIYSSQLSLDPVNGRLSAVLEDATDGAVIFSGNLRVRPSTDSLSPTAGWVGSSKWGKSKNTDICLQAMEVSDEYRESGVSIGQMEAKKGLKLSLAGGSGGSLAQEGDFFSGDRLSVKLEWPQRRLSGTARLVVVNDSASIVLVAAGWEASSEPTEVDLESVPLGEYTMRLEYDEDGSVGVLLEKPFRLWENKVDLDFELYGKNLEGTGDAALSLEDGITGRVAIRSEKPLRGFPLHLTARFQPVEDAVVDSKGNLSISADGQNVVAIPVVDTSVDTDGGDDAAVVSFAFRLPDGPGVLELGPEDWPTDVGISLRNNTARIWPSVIVPAFPGAEGFGAVATGGRGGSVYHVTNLNDAGPGSLRDAVSEPNRTVVFDVGGIINLKSPLACSSNLTIAGQTAPGEGITVFGYGVSFSGQTNVIVRYVRFRSSHLSSSGSKTLNVTEGSNMIFDHCSISWGRWDDLGFTSHAHDITLQNCIISEAIDPQRFGALIDGADRITVIRNLWIDNQSRNPKGKGNLQYINNVVYNWGSNGYVGGHSGAVWHQDIINNYFIAGPSSGGSFLSQFSDTDHVYQVGNWVDLDRNGELGGRLVVESDFGGGPTFETSAYNQPPIAVAVTSAVDAYQQIIAEAGASLHRDSVDERLIDQLRSLGSQGAIIADETFVGGPGTVVGGVAPTDTDQDGMPDDWELARGLDPQNPKDRNGDRDADGYTNLEEYLNSLAHSAQRVPGALN